MQDNKEKQNLFLLSLMNTHSVFYEKTRIRRKAILFILLFLDEKKQKSSDYRIS